MSDPTARLLRWLAAHDTPERVVLLCADATLPRVGRRTLVVQVDGCVTDVGLGLAAQLLASGVAVVEVAPCPTRPEEATATVASWRAVLGDGVAHLTAPRWSRPAREVLRLGQVPLPRRVVLGLRIDPVLDLDLDDAARTLAALRLLHRQGRARVVPQTADPGPAASAEPAAATPAPVPAEATPAPGEDGPAEPFVAADLTVRGCTACGVCVRACPHDALVLNHTGDRSTLTHLREACRSELECVALCPVDAITTTGPLSLAAVLEEPDRVLTTVRTAACTRCGARHPAEEGDLCPPCRFRSSHAFGSAAPPGMVEKLRTLRQRPDRS